MPGEPVASLIGRSLGGFIIKEKIAEGGFGDVYRAEQPGLSRPAVIKVLKSTLVGAEDIVARFIREAQLASRLDHPYAAHVYAFGAEPDGILWIAMELVRGTPLDRLIRAQGHLPLQRLVPFFERVAEVVQTAHDAGIVHRDLKPANVMVLTRAGRLLPKLLDFGIAKVLDAAQPTKVTPVEIPARLAMAETLDVTPAAFGGETSPAGWTRAGSLLGSPPYMAPELWGGEEIDGRTDQYALAVVVYACLTGRLPFEHRSAAELAHAHREAPFPSAGPGLPKEIDAVLGRAAAKRRDDRFPDVLAFAADGAAVAYTAETGVRIGRLDGAAIVDLAGDGEKQRTVAFAPDGRHVAAVDEAGTVRVWDAAGGPPALARGANAGESGLAFSGDEVCFPVGKSVVAWRWTTGKRRVLAGPADVPRTLRALPDGRVAAIAGNELWLWAADGNARKLGDGASLLVSLLVAPDGRTLATGDHADVVELWDPVGAPVRVLRGHTASVDPLAFSADGKLLVSGSYDKTVRVWPLAGGEPRALNGHRTIVRRVAVAPDGSFVVSSGNDDFIRTWDLDDGAAGAFAAHEGAVQGMALSPDGKWLASAGPDGTVRLWETARRDHVPAEGAALAAWLKASTSADVGDFR